MKIEMNDIESHIAGTNDTHNSIQVCSVIVAESAAVMDDLGDLADVLVKQPYCCLLYTSVRCNEFPEIFFYIFIVSDRDPGSLGVRIVSVRAEHIGCVGADGIAGEHSCAAVSVVDILVWIFYRSFHRKVTVSGFQGIDLCHVKRQCIIIRTVLVRISHPVLIDVYKRQALHSRIRSGRN